MKILCNYFVIVVFKKKKKKNIPNTHMYLCTYRCTHFVKGKYHMLSLESSTTKRTCRHIYIYVYVRNKSGCHCSFALS